MKTKIFGMLLLLEALFMSVAMSVSLWYGDDDWRALFVGAFSAAVVGFVLSIVGRRMPHNILSRRECYLVVALVWVVFSVFGLIPYLAYGTVDTVTDAFFETMSGFSTTGASVLNNIDSQPHGILFWRSMTQWMGGLGIVVFSFALIPSYELRNTNMFSAETTGMSVDKLRPKISATARRLMSIYCVLTLACSASYWYCGMGIFDSVCHAMTTIATGGFSTYQSSIAHFHSPLIEYTCAAFMFVSGINFSLFYYASVGHPGILFRNEEARYYTIIVGLFITFTLLLFYYNTYFIPSADSIAEAFPSGFADTVRTSVFHVISIITSTGFQSEYCDYVGWGTIFWMPTFTLMAIGVCAGSTGGGIKVIRIMSVVKAIRNEFILHIHPRAVLPVRLGDNILAESKIMRAMAFIIIYIGIIVIGTVLLSLMGMDMTTSLGSSVSMLSNTGPGMGTTGPLLNFSHCMPLAKWIMSGMMLIGRLEIFTVLFLFSPNFWRDRV